MWLLNRTPSLLTDLYELTMVQSYYSKGMNRSAAFEVFIRELPENWGFFVMAGLNEVASCLRSLCFDKEDIRFLQNTELFSNQFLEYIQTLKYDVTVRALHEGTVFFPNEPLLEVSGPLIPAQILETYMLNILGFSILCATEGVRMKLAADGRALVDFGLRRTQGPVAALRSARGAQIAGFTGTSNLLAADLLDIPPSGTMAHSYIQAHENEEQAFRDFIVMYGEASVLLVDTYNTKEGIKTAARVAREINDQTGLRIKGIRIDSGDMTELSRFARKTFAGQDVRFLKIFLSGGLDEYRITDMIEGGAEADGFGVGTRLGVSHYAPDTDIAYKLIEYGGKGVSKDSPGKETHPCRKSVLRLGSRSFEKDRIEKYPQESDLLTEFTDNEDISIIRERLSGQLDALPPEVKNIRNPQAYEVELTM